MNRNIIEGTDVMRASHVLAVFYVLGAILVTYAGISVMSTVNAVVAQLPVIR